MTTLPEDIRFEQLPDSARKFIAIIDEGTKQGLKQSEIQSNIKAANRSEGEPAQGIRDIYLTQAQRFVRGEEDVVPPADPRFVNLDKRPDPTRARRSKGALLRAFSYTVGIRDAETGDVVGGVQITSSSSKTARQIISEAEKSIKAEGLNVYADDVPDEFELFIEDSIIASTLLLDEEIEELAVA